MRPGFPESDGHVDTNIFKESQKRQKLALRLEASKSIAVQGFRTFRQLPASYCRLEPNPEDQAAEVNLDLCCGKDAGGAVQRALPR